MKSWRTREIEKRIGLLVALAASVALVRTNPFGPGAWAQEPLRVVVLPGTRLFRMAVMEKRGFDRKNGIVVKRTSLISVDAFYTSLRSTETDFGFGAWIATALLRPQGTDHMLVAVVTHDSLVKKRPDAVSRFVKTIRNLRIISRPILRCGSIRPKQLG